MAIYSIQHIDLFLKYFSCVIRCLSSLQDLINAVVTAAEASADNLIRSEGQDIQLQESLDLHLPFLLPEGGYSCETVRGIPQGFREFLEPMCQKGMDYKNSDYGKRLYINLKWDLCFTILHPSLTGLCSLTPQPNSKGDWTIYFSESAPSVESTYLVNKNKKETHGPRCAEI